MSEQSNKVRIIQGVTQANITEQHLNSDSPIVLKDFAKNWPLVEAAKHSDEAAVSYLKGYYNGFLVNTCQLPSKEKGLISLNQEMTGFNFSNHQQDFIKSLSAIIASSSNTASDTLYIGSTSIHQCLPDLVSLCQVTNLPSDTLFNVWAGGKVTIPAHYDVAQNLACCVIGKRRFTLFPPEQIDNLYIGPIDKAPGGQPISLLTTNNPDLKRYPKFRTAQEASITVELNAGDALIIPSMWWHQVEGLKPLNMLFNYWFKSSPAYYGQPTNVLLHAILSIRNLPKHEREAWQKLFAFYVFEDNDFTHIPEHALSILSKPMDELTSRKLRAELQNKLRR